MKLKRLENKDFKKFKKVLRNCWCRETSNDPRGWTPKNPAWGQCAVTALVVQDYMRGFLVKCKLPDGNSHYFNLLPSFAEIDLTKSQFSAETIECLKKRSLQKEIKTRDYVLSYPATVKRYKLLKNKVEKYLEKERK